MRVFLALLLVLMACGPQGEPPISIPSVALPSGSAGPAAWPLTGKPADGEAARTRPIVVKVANDPAARPQSGLADADLILEIPVEGGITRLSLVFQSREPARVGPVRSARQSDLNYIASMKAIVVHVGASEQVAKLVRDAAGRDGFIDVDEFQHPEAFERTTDRVAPYNAYSSAAKIRQAAGRAANERVSIAALRFGDATGGADAAKMMVRATLRVNEEVRYEYDSARSAYHRMVDGQKTMDAKAGEVLPENVVLIKTDITEIAGTADATGAPSVDYRSTGSGPVVILRDGKRFEGTWSRQGSDMYTFKDASGNAIPLKPGLTWMQILPLDVDFS